MGPSVLLNSVWLIGDHFKVRQYAVIRQRILDMQGIQPGHFFGNQRYYTTEISYNATSTWRISSSTTMGVYIAGEIFTSPHTQTIRHGRSCHTMGSGRHKSFKIDAQMKAPNSYKYCNKTFFIPLGTVFRKPFLSIKQSVGFATLVSNNHPI